MVIEATGLGYHTAASSFPIPRLGHIAGSLPGLPVSTLKIITNSRPSVTVFKRQGCKKSDAHAATDVLGCLPEVNALRIASGA